MNKTQAKNVLILMTVILFLTFVLVYIQSVDEEHLPSGSEGNNITNFEKSSPNNALVTVFTPISLEHFSNNNLESLAPSTISSPTNIIFPTDNFIMTHDTALDAYDVINPILTPDDVIYQTTKYQALMENGWFNDFGNNDTYSSGPSPSSSGIPALRSPAPSYGIPAPTTKKTLAFPCSVIVSYSNYKDKNSGLDPFINKTMSVQVYDKFFAAYPIKDDTGAMYFPGVDGMYALWALSVSNNSIICGWHQYASDKAPANNYPNKLVLYIKNVL